MNKFVCIYPQDATTNFLSPLCDHICKIFEAVKVGYDINGDEDPIEQIYKEIQDTQIIFFPWTWYEFLSLCKYFR